MLNAPGATNCFAGTRTTTQNAPCAINTSPDIRATLPDTPTAKKSADCQLITEGVPNSPPQAP